MPKTGFFARVLVALRLCRLEMGLVAQIERKGNPKVASSHGRCWTLPCDGLNGSFGVPVYPRDHYRPKAKGTGTHCLSLGKQTFDQA
jgi:hypothetical protein